MTTKPMTEKTVDACLNLHKCVVTILCWTLILEFSSYSSPLFLAIVMFVYIGFNLEIIKTIMSVMMLMAMMTLMYDDDDDDDYFHDTECIIEPRP